MNLALLVTKKNIGEMEKTALKMGEMQENPVNGAFCVFYDDTIPKDRILNLIKPIASRFPALSYGPVQVNGSLSADLQIAVLFGMLIIQAYSRFPGAWLVVDSYAAPLVKDFMQIQERQHNSFGGLMTGRATEANGAILPVGPVVVDLPHRAIKFLRYPVSTSWRERGQFQFARCRFHNVPAAEYLWSLSETICEPKPELEKEEEPEDFGELDFDNWDKPRLLHYINTLSGRDTAKNTGLPRLISMAKELAELSV